MLSKWTGGGGGDAPRQQPNLPLRAAVSAGCRSVGLVRYQVGRLGREVGKQGVSVRYGTGRYDDVRTGAGVQLTTQIGMGRVV